MTSKVYKSAQGKVIDMGALILQNENVRAVGNMNVNARGDLLDSDNRVIDSKNQQIRRQTQRQTQPAPERKLHTSNVEARRSRQETQEKQVTPTAPVDQIKLPEVPAETSDQPLTGLAAAMARSQGENK